MAKPVVIADAGQVDERVLKAAEDVAEWFEGRRIDWDRFWDRLDDYGFFMPDTASPAATKIERHVREFRKGS